LPTIEKKGWHGFKSQCEEGREIAETRNHKDSTKKKNSTEVEQMVVNDVVAG